MKNRIALIAAYVCVFAIFPCFSTAQSIVINSISNAQFCAGEGVTIDFAVNQAFKRKNAFTLQLSDANGDFQSGFGNLGSIFDSLPGVYSIRVNIPDDVQSSARYRFRILAAIPSAVSADNGKDISIGSKPWIGGFRTSPTYVVAGEPVLFALNSDSLSEENTYHWDFGPDALTPIVTGTVVKNIAFATGGEKIVTVTATTPGGCATSWTTSLHVLGCSPKVPSDALVIKHDTVSHIGSKAIWVNSGVTYTAGGNNTIFAESGSTVLVEGNCTIYLKSGASCIGTTGSCIIFYEDGASLPEGFTNAKHCPTLDFDYSEAPANIIRPLAVANEADMPVALFPNPSPGYFTISGMPTDVREIAVYDVLGTRIAKLDNPAATSFQVDLGDAKAGSYYVRITSDHDVVTKRVVVQK